VKLGDKARLGGLGEQFLENLNFHEHRVQNPVKGKIADDSDILARRIGVIMYSDMK